jgi:hypothetical protein
LIGDLLFIIDFLEIFQRNQEIIARNPIVHLFFASILQKPFSLIIILTIELFALLKEVEEHFFYRNFEENFYFAHFLKVYRIFQLRAIKVVYLGGI